MTDKQINCCDGCQRGLPIEEGRFGGKVHVDDKGYRIGCTADRYRLELEPKSTDTWHKPEVRKAGEAPFVAGGGK